MEKKKKKQIKRKRPMAPWAVGFLKFTQHIMAAVAFLCVAALILTGSVYIDSIGQRSWLNPTVENVEDRVEAHFVHDLRWRLGDVVRFATIRSQLETNGRFDRNKTINVSEYYSRRENYAVQTSENYFPGAVYRLEDLVRWEQAGGLVFDSKHAENMYLTVDGRRLEELAVTPIGFQNLCKQMASCMYDLLMNYSDYRDYVDMFESGDTSFVYYIIMDNEAGDVYTNREEILGWDEQAIQTYFEGLRCSAAGTNALGYDIFGDFALSTDAVVEQINLYEYAFGSSAVVYAGFDMELGTGDYYETIWDAYAGFDPNVTYVLAAIIGGCVLYYLIVLVYLMYGTGRRIDAEGQEYIELNWLDSIYTEVFLGWCFGLGCGIVVLVDLLIIHYNTSDLDLINPFMALVIISVSFVVSILTSESICSLSRRFKAGTLWKNSLIYKVFVRNLMVFIRNIGRKIKHIYQKAEYYTTRSGLWEKTWGAMLIEVCFYGVLLLLITFFVSVRAAELAALVGIIIIGVIVLTSYKRMNRKLERAVIVEKIEGIVAGESCRVEVAHLSQENAALGRAVNEIAEGIQTAVGNSIRDERLKAELLTNVSHDIKTPLTSIINYVDLLKKEPIASEKAKEYIEVLENKSLKLKNLIQDLIEVSKISTGNIEYEMMPLCLHELLMQALAEYDEKFTEHCLRVVYDNDIRDAQILADPRRMWRVMENLLSNIYKYALEGTRIYVEVSEEEENIIMIMKNISAKELNIRVDELTERFVRGDVSRTTEGSGLGLAIAQNLVIGQGGNFQIMMDGDLFKVKILFKRHRGG